MRLRAEHGILIGASLVAILLAEVLVRILSPSPYVGALTTAPQDTFFQHDRLLGWRGVPHATGPFRGLDFDVTVTLDANGHRNDKPPHVEGRRNLLVLGDSYGWGWGVGNEEMFHHEMMRMDESLNVYNLSAPGYGTDQEYLLLKSFLEENPGRRYEGAILLFYQNDFEDNAATIRYSYPKPMFVRDGNGDLALVNVPVPRRPQEPAATRRPAVRAPTWLNRFHLYNLLAHLVRSGGGPAEDDLVSPPLGQEREALDVTLRLIGRIAELSESRDMFFHVVILMSHNVDVESRRWEPFERFLEENRIGFSRFRSRRIPNTDLWLDGHLSARGHRSLAGHIGTYLPGPS